MRWEWPIVDDLGDVLVYIIRALKISFGPRNSSNRLARQSLVQSCNFKLTYTHPLYHLAQSHIH